MNEGKQPPVKQEQQNQHRHYQFEQGPKKLIQSSEQLHNDLKHQAQAEKVAS
jgi:hypothetical protein